MTEIKVRWIKVAKDKSVSKEEGTVPTLPSPGDGVYLSGKGYKVEGHLATPSLDRDYHVLVSEA